MIEVVGNIWNYPAVWCCIPTCGVVNSKKELVMGAGLALQAKRRFPEMPAMLGEHVGRFGNVPKMLFDQKLISFPTKDHWKDSSSVSLIRAGAGWLWAMLRESEDVIALPRVGCGLGNLDWHTQVKPILEERLPSDRFVVISEYKD